MPSLIGRGHVSYNGWTFPPDKTETLELKCLPVKDRAERTFKWQHFTLTLRTILNGNPSDPLVENAVSRLTQPAAGLRYDGRGVGNIRINLGGPTDIKWGPFPTLVSLKPKGGSQTVELIWSVEWHQLTCGDAVYEGQPAEFVFTITTNVDLSGYTKRIYNASLRIPQTRRNADDRRLRTTADEFRERITPALLEGFRRIPGETVLSEDKCEIRLSVTDEQMGPNIPPPGCIQVEADHRIASEPGKFLMWTATFNASYEVALGVPVNAAYDHYFEILRDRIRFIEAAIKGAGSSIVAGFLDAGRAAAAPVPPAAVKLGAAAGLGLFGLPGVISFNAIFGDSGAAKRNDSFIIIPWQFTASEPEMFGKTRVNLAFTYRIINASRDEILTNSGLWRPVPGSDWKKWSASVQNHLGPRGIASLVFSPGEDKIIDLCRPDVVTVNLARKPKGFEGELRTRRPPRKTGTELRSKSSKPISPPPTAKASYIEYTCGLIFEDDHGNVIGTTLPETSLASATRGLPEDAGEVFVQQRTRPVVYVTLVGSAQRAGFPIPVPAIEDINGKTPTLVSREGMGEGFAQAIMGNVGVGLPIYSASWKLRYVLTDPPTKTGTPVPANPLMT